MSKKKAKKEKKLGKGIEQEQEEQGGVAVAEAKSDEDKTAQDLIDEEIQNQEAKSAEPVDADGLNESQRRLLVQKSLALDTLRRRMVGELIVEQKAKSNYDAAKKNTEKTNDEILTITSEISDIVRGNYQNELPLSGNGHYGEDVEAVEDAALNPMDVEGIEDAVLGHLNNSKKKGKAITAGTVALAVYGSKNGQEKDRALLIIERLEEKNLVEKDPEPAKSKHGQKYHVIMD